MSNRDPDARYSESLSQWLDFALLESLKTILHTSVPGIVTEYDQSAKRARISQALNLLRINPGTDATESIPKPPILDVPVVWPSGGGLTFLFPIAVGDPVLLVFSERGIAGFRQSFELSDPAPIRYFEMADAIAVPGFGSFGVAAASEAGATLQTEDGTKYIELSPDRVRVRFNDQDVTLTDSGLSIDVTGDVAITATGEITFQATDVVVEADATVTGDTDIAGDLEVTGTDLTHNSRNVGSSHTHPGVQTGGGITGPPR